MEQYFATIFGNVRHERSPILLLGLVEPDILRQSKLADHEILIIKDLGFDKILRQRASKATIAIHLLDKQFSDQSISYNH